MKRFICLLFGLFFSLNVFANTSNDDYEIICKYIAKISDNDKVNSKGVSLIQGYTASSVIAMIRQDRANFYKFGLRDPEDMMEGDCDFSSVKNRSLMEKLFHKLEPKKETIKAFIEGNPLILAILVRYQNELFFIPKVLSKKDLLEYQKSISQANQSNQTQDDEQNADKSQGIPEVLDVNDKIQESKITNSVKF